MFGLIPNAGKLMNQKLGITTETVSTNANSDFPSLFRPMNIYEKELMQMSIDTVYNDFISKVASGRKLSTGTVDSIGQGRVWSGVNAMDIGLIDNFGGLKAAIEEAAALAGVTTWSLRELPVIEDPYTKLLSQLGGEIKMRLLQNELGESVRLFNELKELKDLSGIQARLPYFIEIH